MRIYISGPISGYDIYERKASFKAVEDALKKMLLARVINPTEVQHDGWSWEDYMERDLELLESCDMLVAMPGWTKSRGAKMEVRKAFAMGLVVAEWTEEEGGEG